MLWALVVLAIAGCSLRAHAQPAVCESDRQCQSGFYCVPDVFLCRRCLDCEDLKRDPPRQPTACIKSVSECGSCVKGLVDDLGGDVTAECVAEAGVAEGGSAALPAWAWAAVTLGLVLFALVVVAVLYVLRNTNTFKILASTRTSVRSPVASAPDEPPPYRAHYHHDNRDHSDHHHDNDSDSDHFDPDAEAGRTRRDPPPADPSAPWDGDSPPTSPRATSKPRPPPSGAREAAARQATRFYSAPYYVRPPRYSDADESTTAPPAPPAPAPPALHDEDTMESTWTPGTTNNGNAAGGELAELLAAARLADQHHLHHHHHHHHPCTQDSNNNRNSGSAGASRGPPPASSAAPVSYIINVVQNM